MSSQPEKLSISIIVGLFSVDGVYMLSYSFLFGASLWVNFIAGVIAYRALARPQFSALQHQIFPVFFRSSGIVSSILLALWTLSHPDVLTNWYNPAVADVAQAWALASVLLAHGANYFVVGPLTSKTMFERQKLEQVEGKHYNDEGVSKEMKALNKRFGSLHGMSSLLSLSAFIALGLHGLWIGNVGLRGY